MISKCYIYNYNYIAALKMVTMFMKYFFRSSLDSSDGAEVFNAEDVYNGIKKASEDIQHLSLLGRQLDLSLAVGVLNDIVLCTLL